MDFAERAPVFSNLPAAIKDQQPGTMEQYDQGYGDILYRTTVPAGPAAMLEAEAVHDAGLVFLDGVSVGVMDRRSRNFHVRLPQRAQPERLDIFVEAMGRVNFGPEVADRKGLHAPVTLIPAGGKAAELTDWQIYRLPLDASMLQGLRYDASTKVAGPAFWRAHFEVSDPGDTFLDLRDWSKGVVWVNGHCLGRFWDIGPTQTAYLPGPWLNKGRNEIVILDLFGPREPEVAGLATPILNQLRPGLDFARSQRPEVQLNLKGATPAQTGQFAPGAQMQEVRFATPAEGRYFCIESLSAQDGKPFAAVAELDLLGADGKPLEPRGMDGRVCGQRRTTSGRRQRGECHQRTDVRLLAHRVERRAAEPSASTRARPGPTQDHHRLSVCSPPGQRRGWRPHQGLPGLCGRQFDPALKAAMEHYLGIATA